MLAHLAIDIAAVAGEQMVLNGGTNLRLHFDRYRYSADLDYSLLGITEAQAFGMIRVAASPREVRSGPGGGAAVQVSCRVGSDGASGVSFVPIRGIQ